MKKSIMLLVVLFSAIIAVGSFGEGGNIGTVNAAASIAGIRDSYSDTWGLVDGLGRTAPLGSDAKSPDRQKYVGMFYFIWHHNLMRVALSADGGAPRNITEIIRNNPETWKTDGSLFGPVSSMHYAMEPLYGYYDLLYDDYVIRQHANQLVDAGVDYIIIDATNFYTTGTYSSMGDDTATLKKICDVYLEMQAEGAKTPQIAVLFTWNPSFNGPAFNYYYSKLYSNSKYSGLWFNYEGKPLVLANPDYVDEAIRDKFTYRTVAPQYSSANGIWQWMSIYPQEVGVSQNSAREIMAVSVAQNWTDELQFMSAVDENGKYAARGRSWTSKKQFLTDNPISDDYPTKEGRNFQEQFDRAVDIDPDMLFVTGWNEWIAGRFESSTVDTWKGSGSGLSNNANFADVFTTEFSRDIEMTRDGGISDNYYNQLVSNIRRYKGVRRAPQYKQIKTIDVSGDFSQWDSVRSYYFDNIADTAIRDAEGFGKRYINETGRNDFDLCKVARDDKNIYFYVQTLDDITAYTDANWMRLFIRTGEGVDWEGFNYVLNRIKPNQTNAVLEKSKGGWAWETAGTVKYKAEGNKLMVAVPMSMLGLDSKNPSFGFKWHDNMQVQGDPLEFYISGDAAPNARFHYVYNEDNFGYTVSGSQNLYDPLINADYTVFSDKGKAAMLFEAVGEFKGVDIMAYNADTVPVAYELSLYSYKGDYAKSVAQKPLATVTCDSVYDKTIVYVGAENETFKSGQYLAEVTVKEYNSDACGIYIYDGKGRNEAFLNGTAENKSLRGRIYYTGKAEVVDGAFENKQETSVLTLKKACYVNGIVLNVGSGGFFPQNFTISYSKDGTEYHDLASFEGYSPTPTDQYFRLTEPAYAQYLSIRDDTGNMLELTVFEATSFDSGGGNKAVWIIAGTIAGAVLIAAGIVTVVLVKKKKGGKKI